MLVLALVGCIGVQGARGSLPLTRDTVLTGLALILGWIVMILVRGGYETRYLGIGSEEFKRVLMASFAVLAAVGVASYLVAIDPPLALVLPAMIMGSLLLLMGRWLMRIWLGRQRLSGRYQQSTLIVGDPARGAELADAFGADPVAGFKVVGSVRPPTTHDNHEALGEWLDDVMERIDRNEVQAVAVAESPAVDPELLRRLAWRLEGPRIDLLVAPALSDFAGPRVAARPAAGFPLLHLDEPSLTGPKRALKRCVDLLIAIPALVVLSPLLVLIGVAIRWDTPGAVLYIGQRVGRSGSIFGCLKFRSMYRGAEALRPELIGTPDQSIAERYRDDPRVTRVGHVLRRWSLDELPQLLNVVAGSMSLVGPRPMLPDELDLIGDAEHRRHLTKPGLTGLWQIAGRKEVSWDDRMRLDLHYVETWSLTLDFVILAKTTKAVLSGHGAY